MFYWFSLSFGLNPGPPSPPSPLAPLSAVPRPNILYVYLSSVICAGFGLCYVWGLVRVMCGALVCLVSGLRYTTARIRELALASLASARFPCGSSLRSLQRVCPVRSKSFLRLYPSNNLTDITQSDQSTGQLAGPPEQPLLSWLVSVWFGSGSSLTLLSIYIYIYVHDAFSFVS